MSHTSNTSPIDQNQLPDGYAFYKHLGSPKFICAPMVEQSELPFRLLCRSYNIPLCYSPMINSKQFQTHPKYAESVFQTCTEDRPLIAQFCGNDPDLLLSAVKLIEHKVDAIDLNFGCPQGIAKRGNYGAFLLKDVDTMCALVSKLHKNLSIPVCAKIRLVHDEEQTFRICQRLRESGLSILTVHGRTLNANKRKTGQCDFEMLRKIKQRMDIPVFANGGCETMKDVMECLRVTGCDGYMAAESILSDPSIFRKERMSTFGMAREYIQLCKVCRDEKQWIIRNKDRAMKGHLFKILYRELTIFQEIRNRLGQVDSADWIWTVVDLLDVRQRKMNTFLYQFIYDKFTVNWYHRHWKGYEQIELMDCWDLIVSECPKPMEENQERLVELMGKYNVLSDEECKVELRMSEEEIANLNGIIQMERDKEQMQKDSVIQTDTQANLINSMFGMHDDSDSDSDDSESIIYDID